jgi:diketogulonate reductase-like aldo/keto reductase
MTSPLTNNGSYKLAHIPRIGYGLGTAWFQGPGHNDDGSALMEPIVQQTVCALETGFRHLDLAEIYGNDREVGQALSTYFGNNPSVGRGDIWITSKLFVGMKDPVSSCDKILARTGCEYLDLLLLHAPLEFAVSKVPSLSGTNIREIWAGMEALVASGKVRFIGVSNFRTKDVDELLSFCRIRPVMNQVEFNPYLQQPELGAYCAAAGIQMAAYSPLGPLNLWPGGPVDEVVTRLAEKYSTTPSCVLLRWTEQKGYVPITTSSRRDRLEEYVSCFSSGEVNKFALLPEELEEISAEGAKQFRRKYWAPEFNDSS